MSNNEEYMSETEDSASDFSASEDDWKPSESESSSIDEDTGTGTTLTETDGTPVESHRKNRVIKAKTLGRSRKQRAGFPISKNVRRKSISALHKSTTKGKEKSLVSDSESSGDDCLVDPDKLDLRSSFFDVASTSEKKVVPPVFDCNAGMRLSDSESEDEEVDGENNASGSTSGIGTSANTYIDLQHLQDFASKLEDAKQNLKKKSRIEQRSAKEEGCNILDLLAMGEASCSANTNSEKAKSKSTVKKKAAQRRDSGSDWEEVQEESLNKSSTVTDIQITVGLPTQKRKDANTLDLEAALKRKLNRSIRDHQRNLHKVTLLCHIANGIYSNKVLNSPSLLQETLKLLPSQNAYPNGRTEIKYFESMVKWYKTSIALKGDSMYPKLEKIPPLAVSLDLQIKMKQAMCKRDYVLIFIILLRAMGIQCRMVANLQPAAIRPPQSDLCILKSDRKTSNKDSSKASVSIANKPKTKQDQIKVDADKKTVTKIEKKEISLIKSTPVSATNSKTLTKRKSLEEQVSNKKHMTRKVCANLSASNLSITDESQNESLNKKMRTTSNNVDLCESKRSMPKISISEKLKKNWVIKKEKKADNIPIVSKIDASEQNLTIKKKQQPSTSTKSLSEKLDKNSIKVPPKMTVTEVKEKRSNLTRRTINRERSTSPSMRIIEKAPAISKGNSHHKVQTSTQFLKIPGEVVESKDSERKRTPSRSKSPATLKISPKFLRSSRNLNNTEQKGESGKVAQRQRTNNSLTIPQLDGADDVAGPSRQRNAKLKKLAAKTISSDEDDTFEPVRKNPKLQKLSLSVEKRKTNIKKTDSDEEFQPTQPKRARPSAKQGSTIEKLKARDRRVLSTDLDDDDVENKKNVVKKDCVDIWVEVYFEQEERWICVDLFKSKVHCVNEIKKSASPIAYVFAWNNDDSIKDVTARYCAQWHSTLQKQRIEQAWLDVALKSYKGKKSPRDKSENEELKKIHLDKPLPATISEYKNHPLYALERHLLKFEAIYPPNALTLGFVRGEPVYARECVHTLHSRDIWLKSAKVVRPGEKPYKIVKARPKWDRLTNTCIKDIPLEIFGYWQTQDYEPPTAENGIVPRNAYGNVELFKKCMLPKKTVHLQLQGLNRVCKKLRIDCAPAMVGFDFHQGACHPLYDGFVVCEEFADQVVVAWHEEQEENERKAEEKNLARIYGNWKKLIRGLQIRTRLKLKYNFDG